MSRKTGVDVILDNVGGPYFQKNLESLGMDGRLFIIGFMGGVKTEANLSLMLGKRLTVQGIILKTPLRLFLNFVCISFQE